MTERRYTADTITDDALDRLYAHQEHIEGAVSRFRDRAEVAGVRQQRAEAERDEVYRERARLVALLAAMTDNAVLAPASDIDELGWQIAYLTIGGRQASWHIHPRDADLFAGVPVVGADDPRAKWDGHSTEEKYRRIRLHTAYLARHCGPACDDAHTYTGRCEGAPAAEIEES